MRKFGVQAMIETALLAAMAMALDLLPSIPFMASGSISFAMIPIFILALRWGIRVGCAGGFLWGVLQIALGDAYIVTPLQGFIEYFIAFTMIGLAGFFRTGVTNALTSKKKGKAIMFITISILTGSVARYFWHFIAGVIFFGKFAPEGMSAVTYSFIVNGGVMVGTFLFCDLVLSILLLKAPRLITLTPFKDKKTTIKISG